MSMVTVVAMLMTTRRATMKNRTVMLSRVWAVMVPVMMVTIVMVTG